jgi:hypothetical protein
MEWNKTQSVRKVHTTIIGMMALCLTLAAQSGFAEGDFLWTEDAGDTIGTATFIVPYGLEDYGHVNANDDSQDWWFYEGSYVAYEKIQIGEADGDSYMQVRIYDSSGVDITNDPGVVTYGNPDLSQHYMVEFTLPDPAEDYYISVSLYSGASDYVMVVYYDD